MANTNSHSPCAACFWLMSRGGHKRVACAPASLVLCLGLTKACSFSSLVVVQTVVAAIAYDDSVPLTLVWLPVTNLPRRK